MSGLPSDEVRRRRIAGLGVILLVGFLMPVILEGGWPRRPAPYFVNLDLTVGENTPGFLAFLAVYPGLAGLAVAFFGVVTKRAVRSLALIVVGLVPVLVLNSVKVPLEVAPGALREAAPSLAVIMLVLFAGTTGVFAAGRAVRYGRASSGLLVGACAGLAYLAGQFVPVGEGNYVAALPVGVVSGLLRHDATFVLATALLAQTLCLGVACVLCIAAVRRPAPSRDQLIATWGFGWLLASICFCVLGYSAQVFQGIPVHLRSGPALTAVTVAAKLCCCVLLPFLLVPLGAADLLIEAGGKAR